MKSGFVLSPAHFLVANRKVGFCVCQSASQTDTWYRRIVKSKALWSKGGKQRGVYYMYLADCDKTIALFVVTGE